MSFFTPMSGKTPFSSWFRVVRADPGLARKLGLGQTSPLPSSSD